MARRVSPWSRPGAEQLHALLGGDPKSDDLLTRVIESLSPNDLADFTVLVLERLARRVESASSGAEIDSLLDADTDIARLESDQAAGDERRADR